MAKTNDSRAWCQPILDEDLPLVLKSYTGHLDSRGTVPFAREIRCRHTSGALFWVHCSGEVVDWDETGRPLRMLGCYLDNVSQDEARLESLLRIIEHPATDTQELLDFALSEAIALTESRLGYIYFYNEESQEFTLNTWSREVMQQCTVEGAPQQYQLEKTGIWGEAVRQRRPILVNDFAAPHPHKKGLPQGHATLHNFLTIPIFHGDRIVAVVGVANKPSDYNELDIRQLKLMMSSVWKIVQERDSERAIEAQNQTMTTLLENLPIGVFMAEAPSGKPLLANKAATELLGDGMMTDASGANLAEVYQAFVADTNAPYPVEKMPIIQGLQGVRSHVEDLSVLRADGQRSTLEVFGSPIFDREGRVTASLVTFSDITLRQELLNGRRSAEAALRESRNRLELAATSAGLGIWDWDIVNNKMLWDDQMFHLYGLSERPAAYGVEIWQQGLHPDDVTSTWEDCQAAIRGERDYEREFRVLHPDGTQRILKANGIVLRDEKGQAVRMLGINRDITEQKLAELSLKSSEARLREVLEGALDAAYKRNLQTNDYEYLSPVFTRISGYTLAEMQSLPTAGVVSLIHPDDRALAERVIAESLVSTNPTVHRVSYRFKHKNGEYRWFLDQFTSIQDDQGRPLARIGTVGDITESKQTEVQLEMHKATIDVAADAAFWMDTEGHFVYVNATACSSLGYTREELLRLDIFAVNPLVTKTRWTEVWALLRSQATFTTESVHRRKDGSEFPVEISATYFRFGEKEMVNGFARDITARKKADEELLKTQRLESLGLLAGGVAHDFNNLLAGIYAYIDMAAHKNADEKSSRYLAKAMNTIERARSLTLQLLTFAKGGVPVMRVGALFPFVQETVAFALSGSAVSCRTEVSPDLALCEFDKNQIGQVIDNIVINAKQAMPEGGCIELSARNVRVSEGNFVVISIKDNGTGIEPHILPRIFDPFFSTKALGHGLGLASCHSIIKRHGGNIEVESVPGKGSTFHLYLPASKGVLSETPETPRLQHRGKGTFLVLDDESIMQEAITEILETIGYTAVCHSDGQASIDFVASELAAGRTVAGMIFDLTVPGGLGGKETIVEIRRMIPETPVFVMSGYSDDPIMAHPQEYGFTASLAKPFPESEFLELLNQYMEKA